MTVLVENWNYLVVICLMMGCLLYTSDAADDP